MSFQPIPKRSHQRLWAILLMLGVAILAVVLVLRALEENILFFYGPTELSEMTEKPSASFRLGGLVSEGSYRSEAMNTGSRHFFSLNDGASDVAVVYEGVLPDLFREGQGIVAMGIWQNDRFEAQELLAKHDENYMPTEVVNALKKAGTWQEENKY